MVTGLKLDSPLNFGAGNVNAGFNGGGLSSLISSSNSGSLGMLDYHQYDYCEQNGGTGSAAPTNNQVCLALQANGTSIFTGAGGTIRQVNTLSTGYATNLPVLLGEYNVECSACKYYADARAGTSIGVAYLTSQLLGNAAQSRPTQAQWGAIWDAKNDQGYNACNYNLVDPSNNLLPQYYALQQLIAKAPGTIVNTASGGTSGGCISYATKTNSGGFFVAIVNPTAAAKTGTVALSHWPINTSGTGTATLWTYPTSPGVNNSVTTIPTSNNVPGVTSTISVNAGVTSSISVPAYSAVYIST